MAGRVALGSGPGLQEEGGQLWGPQLGLTGSSCIGYKHRWTPSGTAVSLKQTRMISVKVTLGRSRRKTKNIPEENEKEKYTKAPVLLLYLATVPVSPLCCMGTGLS